jgi:hypothetical protein
MKMNLPKPTAELSLGKSRGHYGGRYAHGGALGWRRCVLSSQFDGFNDGEELDLVSIELVDEMVLDGEAELAVEEEGEMFELEDAWRVT